MAVEILTKPLDRWDLIAERVYGVPDLAWAIAEANPLLAGDLILPTGIALNIPDLNSLRRPLTAANPAREDDGDFLPLPPNTRQPLPTGGGVVGDFVPLSAIGVTVAPLEDGVVPFSKLPPYPVVPPPPTLTSLGGVSTATFDSAIASMIAAINNSLPISSRGAANGVAPLGADSLVPSGNLPTYPTLASLDAVSNSAFNTAIAGINTALGGKLNTSARSAANGVAPLGADSVVPSTFLPAYPTLTSLGGVSKTATESIDGNKSFTGFIGLGTTYASKKKMITATTAATQGAQVAIAHGVNSTKITSVTGVIFYTATTFPLALDLPSVPLGGRQAGFSTLFNISSSNISVINETGNSGNLLSRPFYLIVEYIE
jgi:phage tail protein X